MLYVLPPPRAPSTNWNNVCDGVDKNDAANADNTSWNGNKRRPPRIRLRDIKFINNRIEDGSTGTQNEMDANRNPKSLSECYFAGKGTALVLPAAEAQKSTRRNGNQGSNIQKHLQSMFYLLRQEETLKMAVKLESVHPNRTRYLVVVSRTGGRGEECCLLGIDCNEKTTVGLVLKVLADTTIRLDGDGGFSVSVCNRHHIFKPVSVQAMWSALQTLHKVSSKAREQNFYQGGSTHGWVGYYENRIESDRSCLNEWHAMDNLESKRPPSPDSIRTRPTEREEAERVIRATLKEIMMSVDLDEVTSKYIRGRLEEDLDMDLAEYKSFIDQEMLTILGQMDAPTEIFDHVYLGSEWNASNYEELQRNGVGHILNVTREIDNFFPGSFNYLNIRVCDDEKTDLLKYWDDTFKYITKARSQGSKVLVHCKMGVSRSASVVIAYAMKACDWNFTKALQHVKEKRSCIKPNQSFLSQLETYQGILDAMKNKAKLQRSKAESKTVSSQNLSGQELKQLGERPKSWSPDNKAATELDSADRTSPVFLSLEDLTQKAETKVSPEKGLQQVPDNNSKSSLGRHVLLPCDNGESYSVSPNQIVHLNGQHHESSGGSVKERVSEFESNADGTTSDRRKLVLNLSAHLDNSSVQTETSNSDMKGSDDCKATHDDEAVQSDGVQDDQHLDNKTPSTVKVVEMKNETWDPGEKPNDDQSRVPPHCNSTSDSCDSKTDSVVSDYQTVWTSSTVVKTETVMPFSDNDNSIKVPESPQTNGAKQVTLRKDGDPFSSSVDRVFDREEKKQQRISVVPVLPVAIQELSNDESFRECPSRQHSWSSYDSAVVLGYPNETQSDVLSRHSSWGSGDTRTLPSRNSSWGSYDMRTRSSIHYINENGEKVLHPSSSEIERSSSGVFPYDKDEIPWHPGTVRRTRQKLEETALKKSDDDDNSSIMSSSHSLVKSPSSETLLFDYPLQETPLEAVNSVLIESSNHTGSIQPLTENSKSSAISDKIDIPKESRKQEVSRHKLSRLSASAPECSSMVLVSRECPLSRSESNVSRIERPQKDRSDPNLTSSSFSSVKQHRNILENLHKETCTNRKLSDDSDSSLRTNSTGIVKNLKKEFEARTGTNNDHNNVNPESSLDLLKPAKSQVSSLPSSPVSLQQHKEKVESAVSEDDMSVKNLLGRFENNKQESVVNLRSKGGSSAPKPFKSKNTRHSCIEVSINKSPPPVARIAQTPLITSLNKNCLQTDRSAEVEYKRPPIIPTVRNSSPGRMVAATVIAKAAKKQQQYGRSHPLALLNINPRHNNPVYNTM